MHRLIINVNNDSLDIDHINHNVKNNKKSNLRIVTHQQNMMNMNRKNKYKCVGVSFDSKLNKYISQISYKGKHYVIGLYENVNDAIKSRKQKEIELFGEYRCKG